MTRHVRLIPDAGTPIYDQLAAEYWGHPANPTPAPAPAATPAPPTEETRDWFAPPAGQATTCPGPADTADADTDPDPEGRHTSAHHPPPDDHDDSIHDTIAFPAVVAVR